MWVEQKHITAGILGGMVAGIFSGMVFGMFDMLPIIARLIGSSSAVAGFFVQLLASAIIGFGFALIFGRSAEATEKGMIFGLIYGAAWWVLNQFIFMPVILGMGVLTMEEADTVLPGFFGYLVYGFVLGLVYPWFAHMRFGEIGKHWPTGKLFRA